MFMLTGFWLEVWCDWVVLGGSLMWRWDEVWCDVEMHWEAEWWASEHCVELWCCYLLTDRCNAGVFSPANTLRRDVVNSQSLAGICHIGAVDLHRAMVATVPAEKLLTGRRPCCEELDPPYDIKIVSVQKITVVFRKINRNCCRQSCTCGLQYAADRLLTGCIYGALL